MSFGLLYGIAVIVAAVLFGENNQTEEIENAKNGKGKYKVKSG